jgi:hypothetical protein
MSVSRASSIVSRASAAHGPRGWARASTSRDRIAQELANKLSGATAIRFASRLSALSMSGPLTEQAFAGWKSPLRAVAQMVGFGRGRSKMLYLSMGID